MTQHTKTAVLPQPSDREAKAIEGALARRTQRAPRARPNLKQTKPGHCELSAPHSNAAGWQARLENALGTCSADFLETELKRLANVLRDSDGNLDSIAIDAVFAVLDGAQPKNEIEAMLLIQMAATHALAMKKAATLNQVKTILQQDSAGLALMRLNRTFTAQVEALASLRRGGRQRMTVEHVHIYPGGRAIVGDVTHMERGAHNENSEQPHGTEDGRAITFTQCPTVWGSEPQRETVSVARGEGKEAVPNARRSARVRSAQRAAKRKL